MELPIIKNFDNLNISKIRNDSLSILEEGYESIIVEILIRSKINIKDNYLNIGDEKINLDNYEKIFLIAVGKCAVSSTIVFEELLGDRISAGIVLDVRQGKFKNMISEAGTHPFPSEKNVFITKSIVDILKDAGKRDLILTIISGGGSSLLCLPDKITCDEQKNITDELMRKGATIKELNTIRKHTSKIKGGQFSKIAYPSTVVSVILSDVPGDDLSVIASGPTVKDETTIKDAEKILDKYDLENWKKYLVETPKKDKYFEKTTNILLGSNLVALETMKKKAEELGYNTYIENTKLEGEARILGKELIMKEYLPMSCHIWGGETTVKIEGLGKGGRNQEFVLGALPYIQENMIVIGSASDGWDNSDMAGAIGDEEIYKKSLNGHLEIDEFLKENNSYEFFKQVGGHIRTGRTGSNVADFYIILRGDSKLEEISEFYDENKNEENYEEEEINNL